MIMLVSQIGNPSIDRTMIDQLLQGLPSRLNFLVGRIVRRIQSIFNKRDQNLLTLVPFDGAARPRRTVLKPGMHRR